MHDNPADKVVGHIVRPLNDAPLGLARSVVAHDAVAHAHRDAEVRLARLGDQQQDVLIARFCRKGGQMATDRFRYGFTPVFSTPPSTPERTRSRPDQFSAVNVVSRPAR